MIRYSAIFFFIFIPLKGEVFHQQFLLSDGFIHLIYKRYFLIEKLKPLFDEFTIDQYYYSPSLKNIVNDSVRHPLIVQSVKNIKAKQNLKGLFKVWGDFIQYRNIEDEEFTQDFIKEIKTVASMLIFKGQETDFDKLIYYGNRNSINQDRHHFSRYDSLEIEQLEAIQTDTIFSRFYLIQRLNATVKSLLLGYQERIHLDGVAFNLKEEVLYLENFVFKDYRVVNCFKQMLQENNFLIYQKLWAYFKSYQAINDQIFEKEFALFSLYWYQEMVKAAHLKNSNILIQHKAGIADLPLEDILDALDYLTDELPLFLEKYEFKSELTWKEWFKKYWLIGPIAVAGFAIRMYLMLKKDKNS